MDTAPEALIPETTSPYDGYDTVPHLAAKYHVAPSTFYAAAKTGRVISKKVGGRVLINTEDADRYAHLVNLYAKN